MITQTTKSFSLLEILIATTILIVAILGIAVTFLSIANLNTMTKDTSFATNQARKIMEEVRGTEFKKIFSTYQNKDYPVPSLNLQEGDADGFVAKITVVKVNNKKELLEITVKLDWRGKAGNRSLMIKSRIMEVKKKKKKPKKKKKGGDDDDD